MALLHRPTVLTRKAVRGDGFTIIELLVVVAILGVLAAVGIPMLTGYISDTKRSSAEQGLRSIYLMQQDYKREEGQYYTAGRSAQQINTDLFSGNETLDTSGDYTYTIQALGTNGFRATATSTGSMSCVMTITQNNKINKTGCN